MTSRTQVVETLRRCRVVPVTTIEDPADAPAVAQALLDGGIACIEVTFRHAAAAEAIRRLRTSSMLVGVGTVLLEQQVEEALAAGADFAVAPGYNDAIVDACERHALPFFPGVATPSEIDHARQRSLDVLKVFPVSCLGGPAFLRAVSATFSDVRFIPTGGVDAENLAAYLAVPSVVACGGSWLVAPDLIRGRRFDEIARLARIASRCIG